MRLQYVASACVVIEARGVRVLCDPWLTDGIYGGAWYHNPPLTVTPEDFHDCQFCFISHCHPDHCDVATLERLSRDTVILMARYDASLRKPMAIRLRGMGFSVIELPHDQRYTLANGFTIQVIPADDCNPAVCGQFFGCAMHASPGTTTQIDSLAVFQADGQTIVNVNDLPYGLSHSALERVAAAYPSIDLLCVGYAGAGPYPQCFRQLTADQKRAAATAKRQQFIDQMRAFVNYLDPDHFLPFAGQYTLGGSLVDLNDWRGVPELEDLYRWPDERMVLLNRMAWFDCATAEPSEPWKRDDPVRRATYRELLRRKRLDHEADEMPMPSEVDELIASAEQAWRRRASLIETSWRVRFVVDFGAGDWIQRDVSLRDDVVTSPTLIVGLDARLLRRIMTRQCNFNNAEVGSLLQFERTPDVYDRGLFHALSFLHV